MTTFAQYGIRPCAYDVAGHPGVKIEKREPSGWTITSCGTCLNGDGEWEYEPQPSSRSDEFKTRTRFPLATAMQLLVDRLCLRLIA